LRRDESGASLVEYAILLSFIAGVCITAVAALGWTTLGLFRKPADLWPPG
jgi:Flp pilus assembly pilin Flp